MPEHMTRDERALYDHESPEAPRRRPADDWGIDESFPRVRGRRFARDAHAEGPPRSRRRPGRGLGRRRGLRAAPSREPDPEEASPPPSRCAGTDRGVRRRRGRRRAGARGGHRGPPHDPHQRPPRRGVGDRALHVRRAPPPAAADRRGAPGGRSDADHRLGVRARAAADPHRDPYLLEGRLRSPSSASYTYAA